MYKFDIKDLNLYYGDFHALHGINMQIEPNEITAFIGPSGCGKSLRAAVLSVMCSLMEKIFMGRWMSTTCVNALVWCSRNQTHFQ